MFDPMYKLAGMGDPWTYYAVHGNKDRTTCTIIQGSRFGIGDVTFLMCAYGKLEYVEDTLKRLSEQTLHLTSGRKLANVGVILKALGLLGDYHFDRMHKMKQVVGQFCDGDYRRPFNADATGMHAANFTTFSGGIGYKDFAAIYKHLLDFPKIFSKASDQGLLEALPVHKSIPEEEKPAYAININHAMSSGMILGGMCPETVPLNSADEEYKHRMYHVSHPTRYFMEQCIADWDCYQAEWKRQGSTQEYIPYPYTYEMLEKYVALYNKATGQSISAYGPPKDQAPVLLPTLGALGGLPAWAASDAALVGAEVQVNNEHKHWWATSASTTMYDGFLRKERPHPTQPGMTLPAPGWWEPAQLALSQD